MRRKATAVAIALALVLSVIPSPVAVATPTHIVTYTQREGCVIGPCCFIVGEWTRLCNGTWVGWGARPGDPCTYTEERVEEEC
jgi:hypothetical protein